MHYYGFMNFMRTDDMTTPTNTAAPAARYIGGQTVPIRAHYSAIKKLGHWTRARRLDVRATRGSVLLDLRSNRIEDGDLEIHLDIDHAMVKLLVPDGAILDHDELRRVGSGKVKDWTGTGAPGGRTIHLTGEMRKAEVRVHRGGVAIVSAMLTREYLADLKRAFRANQVTSLKDVRAAYREGRWTTIDDPGRSA